jgi:hypothetical protein
MAHNLKPNTDYVIVTLQVAVPKSLYESGDFHDGMSCLMDAAMFDNNNGSRDGVVGDWQYPRPNDVDGEFRTGDETWEGQTFQNK